MRKNSSLCFSRWRSAFLSDPEFRGKAARLATLFPSPLESPSVHLYPPHHTRLSIADRVHRHSSSAPAHLVARCRSLLSGPASRTGAAADLCFSHPRVVCMLPSAFSVCTCVDVIQHPALVAALPAVVGPSATRRAELLSELFTQSLSVSVHDCLSSMTVLIIITIIGSSSRTSRAL